MTNELEKKFFDTFGIEPKELNFKTMNCACGCHDCENCEKYKNNFSKIYPQITDHILLELICIDFEENPYKCRGGVDITNVKEYILNEFIREYEYDLYGDKQDIKHQVRKLFEEG